MTTYPTIARWLMAACAFACITAASLAAAQTPRADRPYRGLFRGVSATTEQVLSFDVAAGGGFDHGPSPVVSDTTLTLPTTGQFAQYSADLAYSLNRRRIQFGASAATAARYYSLVGEDFLFAHSGAISGAFQLAKNTRLSATQWVSYQPLLSVIGTPQFSGVLLGDIVRVRLDEGLRDKEFLSYMTSVDLSHRVSRRGVVNAAYQFHVSEADEDGNLTVHTGSVGYSLGVTRNLSLRIGYGRSIAKYPTGEPRTFRSQNIDAGVQYDRPLGRTRRTTVSFSTGATALDDEQQTTYRVIGRARLNREIRRTWNASGYYQRDVQYLDAYRLPLFADVIGADVSGLLNRRAEFRSHFDVSRGTVGFTGGNNEANSYVGTVGLTYGLYRQLALDVDYFYVRHQFGGDTLLPASVLGDVSRQGVTANVRFWMPLLEIGRKTDAAR